MYHLPLANRVFGIGSSKDHNARLHGSSFLSLLLQKHIAQALSGSAFPLSLRRKWLKSCSHLTRLSRQVFPST
jgi:hypothetical protein